MSESLKTPKANPTLPPTGLSVADYKRTLWFVTSSEGVTVEHVLEPEYWAHVAQRMKPFDRIELVSYDGTWMVDLLVITTGKTAAKVIKLHEYTLDGTYADLSSVNRTHEIKHRGPRKWSIIRISDGAVVKENIDTRDDAERELADYMKALGH